MQTLGNCVGRQMSTLRWMLTNISPHLKEDHKVLPHTKRIPVGSRRLSAQGCKLKQKNLKWLGLYLRNEFVIGCVDAFDSYGTKLYIKQETIIFYFQYINEDILPNI